MAKILCSALSKEIRFASYVFDNDSISGYSLVLEQNRKLYHKSQPKLKASNVSF